LTKLVQYDDISDLNFGGKQMFKDIDITGEYIKYKSQNQLVILKEVCSSIRFFHPVKSLSVSRDLWLILLSKISLFLNLVKLASENF
jgi:hypothetical protein